MTDMVHILDEATLERLLHEERAVLFKHSPACGTSFLALRELRQFAANHAELPVYMVDVLRQRALSDLAAERLGVGHESPQVIVLQRGTPVWNASHHGVKAEALATQVG